MDLENLVQVHGAAKSPPETITTIATDDDGTLYRLSYSLETIEETDDPE